MYVCTIPTRPFPLCMYVCVYMYVCMHFKIYSLCMYVCMYVCMCVGNGDEKSDEQSQDSLILTHIDYNINSIFVEHGKKSARHVLVGWNEYVCMYVCMYVSMYIGI